MIREFERYVEKGQAFVQAFAAAIGEENLRKASEVLERVFAAMRQHLPFHESVNVMECLPMAIRGLYMNGWTLSGGSQRLTTTDSFVREIAQADDHEAEAEAVDVAKAAIETIAEFSAGLDRLPKGLRNLYQALARVSRRDDSLFFDRFTFQ
ncbi:MAG TPA: DUF2267 domain-containing protein [Cyclobacteriaceae bacterium]|jgi:uncharacterized protein (DUF2267 family)